MLIKLRFLTSFTLATLNTLACAQNISPSISPGSIDQQQRETERRQNQDQRLFTRHKLPEITIPSGATKPSVAQEIMITIKRIKINPSQLLNQDFVDAILKPLEGSTVTLAQLQQAVQSINNQYKAAGHATARAILPPQTIKNGLVRMRLIEARVGEIRILNAKVLHPDFVLNRVDLPAGELLSVPYLEQLLIRFNRLHEEKLRASVVAGQSFGTTDVELSVIVPKRARWKLFMDNSGRPTVGDIRAGLNARFTNLIGHADLMQLTATITEGSENYALSYSVPLNPNGLRLDLNTSKGDISIVDGPFEPLNITGSSFDHTVGVSYPLKIDLENQSTIYGRLSARESASQFGGLTQEKSNLSIFTVGMTNEHQSNNQAWYLDNSLSFGVKDLLGGNEDFWYYRGNATRFDRLNERFQLLLRGGLQLSDTELLPSSGQFQVGGAYTVRGFSEGLLSGRNGYFVSAELRIGRTPEERQAANSDTPDFTGVLFIDHGGAIPFRPAPLKATVSDDFITSIGIGLLFNHSERLTGRIAIAQPLRNNSAELDKSNPRIHASVSIAF